MKRLNIVEVAAHACIRVHKQAIALINNGHRVHIIANRIPVFAEAYKTIAVALDTLQYSDAIEIYSKKADIFHVHNEPSWFVTAIKEVCDKPVILDVHDSFLARLTPEEEEKRIEEGGRRLRIYNEERNNFQLADGLVFPSKPFGDMILNEYKLTQPSLVLESYLPESLYVYDCKEHWGGLVYQGRVDLTDEIKKNDKLYGFVYCNYEEFANKCKEVGIDFHLMANRSDKAFLKVYQDVAFTHEPYHYDVLLKRLSRHDWGLVGNIYPTSEWDIAMPNKLFEYIAACVPIVSINAKACSEFIEKYGVGITVNSIEELVNRWTEHRQCRENIVKHRKEFTMDRHIGKLEELYEAYI